MKWQTILTKYLIAIIVQMICFYVKVKAMYAQSILNNGLKVRYRKMSDKNLNEWLFADIDDLIDCDYSDENEVEIK